VLVGNKTDLRHERKVSKEEGQQIASQWSSAFIECSGKHNENIGVLICCCSDRFKHCLYFCCLF
jgi:hypothetical protein